jgi:hypothetical protein
MTAKCDFCGRTEDLGKAIDEGWIPDHYRPDGKCGGPACPACADLNLQFADDGEYELIQPTII